MKLQIIPILIATNRNEPKTMVIANPLIISLNIRVDSINKKKILYALYLNVVYLFFLLLLLLLLLLLCKQPRHTIDGL